MKKFMSLFILFVNMINVVQGSYRTSQRERDFGRYAAVLMPKKSVVVQVLQKYLSVDFSRRAGNRFADAWYDRVDIYQNLCILAGVHTVYYADERENIPLYMQITDELMAAAFKANYQKNKMIAQYSSLKYF